MSESKLSGCFSSCGKCLEGTGKIFEFGDEIIEIVELALPNPVEKAICNSIQAILKASTKAFVSLAKSCKDKAIELEAADAEKLKKLGLVQKDGSICPSVSSVVNKMVEISPK